MSRPVGRAKVWAIAALAAVASAALLVAYNVLPREDRASPSEGPAAAPFHVASPGASTSKPTDPLLEATACAIQLDDVTSGTGITFKHTDGSSGRRYIVEPMCTGMATFDFDNDGLIDIYFPNGAPLPGCETDEPARHALYKNLGDWKFQDVTETAGVVCSAYGMGITIGDYDNDGFADIYLNCFGKNLLYHNNGDGTFTDVTRRAGVAGRDLVAAGACFLDIEGDGDLDLYVGNYIELDCSAHVPHTENGHPAYPSPQEYEPVLDTLYRNNGDGTFTDVTGQSGIGDHAGRSMGMICADYDNDGDTDVFICNDVQENFFFRNDGKGNFEEFGVMAGVAMNRQGHLIANMGVDCADYDHDGLLDFYTTNYQAQLPMLLRNFGDHVFDDVASWTNAVAGCLPYVNWGCGFVDFDNDCHRDLFIANGHTEDNIEERDLSATYRCPNLLLRNTGTARFVDVSSVAGDGLSPVEASRGTAFDDLDNDGDIDMVVLNSRELPTVARNMLGESDCANHWLQIRLRGTKTNRDGVGAHVTVVTDDLKHLVEVHSGRGYQSHWGSRLHFGLAGHDHADRIEIRWVGGATEVIENVKADQLITIIEGTTSDPRLNSTRP